MGLLGAAVLLALLAPLAGARDNVWEVNNGLPDAPEPRFGVASAVVRGHSDILLHGGAAHVAPNHPTASPLRTLSDTWVLNVRYRVWVRLLTVGHPPPALALHTISYDPALDPGTLGTGYVFGGTSAPFSLTSPTLSDTLWELREHTSLELGTRVEWVPVNSTSSLTPLARAAHTSVFHRGHLIVHGGYVIQEGPIVLASPETWVFSPATRAWTLIEVAAAVPRAAFASGIVMTPGPTLVVLGGFSGAEINQYPFLFVPAQAGYNLTIDRLATLDLDALADVVAFGNVTSGNTTGLEWELGESFSDLAFGPMGLIGGNLLPYGGQRAAVVGGFFDGISVSYFSVDINFANATGSRLSISFGTNGGSTIPARAFALGATATNSPPAVYGGLTLAGIDSKVWVYDVKEDVWFPPELTTTPKGSVFASGAVLRDNLYVYGGYASGGLLSTLWRLNLETHQWTSFIPNNFDIQLPGPYTQQAMAAWERSDGKGYLLMIGGLSVPQNHSNEVWAFDIESGLWSIVARQPGSLQVFPSIEASAVVMNDKLVVFGGFRGRIVQTGNTSAIDHEINSELLSFDLLTGVWTNLTTPIGPAPPSRAGHAADVIQLSSGPAMIVYGGSDSFRVLSDVWLYRPETRRWLQLTDSAPAGPRCAFGMGTMGPASFLVHGGIAKVSHTELVESPCAGSTLADGTWAMYVHDNMTLTWRRVDAPPSPWAKGVAAVANSQMTTVFGVRSGFAKASEGGLVFALSAKCGDGSFSPSFIQAPCAPCPTGTYRSLGQGSDGCTPCPKDITTGLPGAVSVKACDLCLARYCHDQGSCSVAGNLPSCSCYLGYGGPRCKDNLWAIGLGGTLLGLMAVSLVALIVWRTRRKATFYMKQTELQEKLLQDTEAQLELFDRVWSIDPTELRMISMVDSGAYGEVWRAEYADKPVAVKKMHAALVEVSHDVIDEFKAEIETLKVLRHSNIVFFYGGGVWDDGVPFLVTEYFERGSLRKVLEDESIELGFETQLGFARDTAHGMMFLHKFGHIHRDLKSGNLLISDNWRVKVADFGTARLCSCLADEVASQRAETPLTSRLEDQANRELTSFTGTLVWSAPEVLRGDTYDQSADVYSYGVVLWEILARQAPWAHLPTTWAIREAVEAGERPTMPADGPRILASLAQESWRQEAHQRPSFKEIASRLEAGSPD